MTLSVLLIAAGWFAARFRVRRFRGANKGTHELAIDLGGDHVDVEAFGSKDVFRFFGAVNARRLDLDGLKSGGRQLGAVLRFVEGSGNTADPQQNALADFGVDLAARDHVGNGKAAARLQYSESLAQ